ncbi:MAG TPA: hypothetical protein DIC34_17195 [Treponema sp.]|nr:hypothetical protein [Treponema sp.]
MFTSRNGHNKFEGDNVLKTDAHQIVDVYKKDDDGNWVADGQQDDSGYNIHDGDEEYADYTKPTDGCIRVEKATSKILKDLLDKIKSDGGSMKLIVKE